MPVKKKVAKKSSTPAKAAPAAAAAAAPAATKKKTPMKKGGAGKGKAAAATGAGGSAKKAGKKKAASGGAAAAFKGLDDKTPMNVHLRENATAMELAELESLVKAAELQEKLSAPPQDFEVMESELENLVKAFHIHRSLTEQDEDEEKAITDAFHVHRNLFEMDDKKKAVKKLKPSEREALGKGAKAHQKAIKREREQFPELAELEELHRASFLTKRAILSPKTFATEASLAELNRLAASAKILQVLSDRHDLELDECKRLADAAQVYSRLANKKRAIEEDELAHLVAAARIQDNLIRAEEERLAPLAELRRLEKAVRLSEKLSRGGDIYLAELHRLTAGYHIAESIAEHHEWEKGDLDDLYKAYLIHQNLAATHASEEKRALQHRIEHDQMMALARSAMLEKRLVEEARTRRTELRALNELYDSYKVHKRLTQNAERTLEDIECQKLAKTAHVLDNVLHRHDMAESLADSLRASFAPYTSKINDYESHRRTLGDAVDAHSQLVEDEAARLRLRNLKL